MRSSLLSLPVGLALFATACGPDLFSGGDDEKVSNRYLALGDSITFGWDPFIPNDDPTAFKGYPEELASRLDLELTNASCPGEASGGFISPTGNDNNCRQNKMDYPLHVAYDGTQLEFALDYLTQPEGAGLVTINLGGNDLSKANDECMGDISCTADALGGVLLEYSQNMETIFRAIREDAGYDGRIVALTLYNPDPNTGAFGLAVEALNRSLGAQAAAFDVDVADAYYPFLEVAVDVDGDPCLAGLLIPLEEGGCDIHPSELGDKIMADAIDTVMMAE